MLQKFRFANWACDRLTEDADCGKKNHLFRWRSFWSWLSCKQAKLSHLAHRKSACIHWKSDASKLWSRGIIGPFFFENVQGVAVTINGDCYRAMFKEFLFTKIEEEGIGNIWPHRRSYTRCFASCFWWSYYQPQNWYRLAISELRFDTVGLLLVGCRQR